MAGSEKTACLFPGQGSQKRGMGEDLFGRYPDMEAEADAILGYSIRRLCLDDPDKQLKQTQFTQPALFVVNAMSYRAWQEKAGGPADMLAGHSLGEYNALHAAGVFDFATGLKLVRKRGEIMARVTGGGMAAVVGLTPGEIQEVLARNDCTCLDLANLNSPNQTVLSGLASDVQDAARYFKGLENGTYIPLQVSGAFHSRYMEAPRTEFEAFIQQFDFEPPERTVISNVEARPYEFHRTHELLARQITHPVRWMETVQVMMGAGVTDFHEAGPGNVLTRLVKDICEKAPALAIDWPV